MGTIAAAMNRAARGCSVAVPTSWITASGASHMLMKDMLLTTAEELLDRHDWPSPISVDATITGTGAENYDLASDFRRLARGEMAVYETARIRRAGIPVTDNGDWTNLKEWGTGGGFRYYRTGGNESDGFTIGFYPLPVAGDTITVSYISQNWLVSGGTAGTTWATNDDTLRLPDRLIELGVIWRFRQRNGMAFQDRLAEYEAQLTRLANDSRVRRTINAGGRRMIDHPMRVPVPDFIPGG